MKALLVFVTCAALFAAVAGAQSENAKTVSPHAGTPTARPPGFSTTQPSVDPGCMVNDVRIELALFGSGTHLVDVTDRVVALLRAEPDGFAPRANTLKVDPTPGRNKSLLIRYRYHDQERLFMVTGGNLASYAALVEEK